LRWVGVREERHDKAEEGGKEEEKDGEKEGEEN
jgi:hypothetical protein